MTPAAPSPQAKAKAATAKPAVAAAPLPLKADAPPPPVEIPFGSPAQQAAEKQAQTAAVAQAAAVSWLPEASAAALSVPPFDELTMILFGRPGSGKSILAAGNPGAYFLSLEPGQNFIKAAKAPPITKWADFQQHVVAIHQAKKSGKLPFHTAVVDIIDILSGYCYDFVLQKNGLAEMPEDYGKTWKKVRAEWERWIRGLMRTVNVVFITHCNETKRAISLDNGIKQEVLVSVPTFAGGSGGKMGEYLDGVVNAMGNLRIKGNGRHAISFLKDSTTDAKDRTDILGKLGEIELSPDLRANWQLVSKLYADKAKEMGLEVKSLWQGGERV